VAGHNPYAPSNASLGVAGGPATAGGIWRDDDRIILAHGAAFPHRCVKCNQPSLEPHKVRQVYWHPPSLYLLILLNIIVYAIAALFVRKKAEIDPGLCSEHLGRRRMWIAIGWGGAVGSLLLLPMAAYAMGMDPAAGIPLAIPCILIFAILGILNSRLVYPKYIDDRYVRLKGADERFLASLPKFLNY
jgi:hypothetical protein